MHLNAIYIAEIKLLQLQSVRIVNNELYFYFILYFISYDTIERHKRSQNNDIILHVNGI